MPTPPGFYDPRLYDPAKLKQKTPEELQKERTAARTAQFIAQGSPVGFSAGLAKGRELSKELTGSAAINAARADMSPESQALVKQAMEQAKGLTSDQNQALINQARHDLIAQQVGNMRSMRGSLAANGVRGGAAVGAQAGVAAQSAANLGQFYNQNVINNVQAQQTGLANAAKVVGQQDTNVNNLVDTRGKVVLGIGDIGQQNSTALLQAEQADLAAEAQKKAAGGGSSFICTELRRHRLMTPFESWAMTGVLLRGVVEYPLFVNWYIRNGDHLIDVANEHAYEWAANKHLYVDDILTGHERSRAYINATANLCAEVGFEMPPEQRGLFGWLKGAALLLTAPRFWKRALPTIQFYRAGLKKKRRARAARAQLKGAA